MTLLPLVVSGIVMILVASYSMKTNIEKEADNNLKNVATSVLAFYDYTYPGEYEAQLENDEVVLYKGDTLVSRDFSVIDRIKQERNIEISIFMMDTRLVTTLTDQDGNRLNGTVAADTILKDVYESISERFYDNVAIEGHNYYAYYKPIMSSDNSKCLGMIGVAEPAEQVQNSVKHSVIQNVIIMGLAMLVTGTFIVLFAHKTVLMIKYMVSFMKKLADNKLDATLNEAVTHRDDELGVMGKMLVDLQISLRRLIERDVLTGLYNRRYAEKKIDAIENSGVKYCVSIGDIDHFKKFNDSFGHECGDVVLKEVAACLNEGMRGRGFVARWGGEEFLLVFENTEELAAGLALTDILQSIRDRVIEYDGQQHSVTMTFGVVGRADGESIADQIRRADDKLYEGKQGGRNRVIV